MRVTNFVVLYSALITKICLGGLVIETCSADKSGLVEATINVLKTCYLDRIGTVGLAGVLDGCISKSGIFRDIPVTLIEETSRVVNNGPSSSESRYKLQVFVVTVNNSSTLAKTLTKLKYSRWWNHMATFLLLDWPVSQDGCSNAYEILWETWKSNLLNSKFVCLHQTRGKLIYTYNPYTSKAPVPWQLENTYKGQKNHVWSLFARVYREDEEICDALDFDPTTDLGGYEIRVSGEGLEKMWPANPNVKPNITHQAPTFFINRIFVSSFNATWKFRSYPVRDSRSVDANGDPYDAIADIVDGISDMGLNIRNQYSWVNVTTTYPFVSSGLAIMTQYRGHMSQLAKIASVLDVSSRFGVFLVLLLTLLFFKCYLRKPLMSAILNLVLLVCNAALLKLPTELAPRIYLGCLFMFVLTIQGIYQSQLASLLTKRVPLPNVNNMEDLARFGYTIYGNAIHYPTFNNSVFEGRYVALDVYDCTDYVLRDSKAACANNMDKIIFDAARLKLHLSREIVATIHGVYLIRSDFPLEERVNTVLRRCVESNLFESRLHIKFRSTKHILESYENEDEHHKSKVINLKELGFAFGILAIGLGFATITFVIEL